MAIVLALALATVLQFDAAGRKAFTALRDFQMIELVANDGPLLWPGSRHTAIAGKLSAVLTCIDDGMAIGVALQRNRPISAVQRAQLRAGKVAMDGLRGMVDSTASVEARAAFVVLDTAFGQMLALYPP